MVFSTPLFPKMAADSSLVLIPHQAKQGWLTQENMAESSIGETETPLSIVSLPVCLWSISVDTSGSLSVKHLASLLIGNHSTDITHCYCDSGKGQNHKVGLWSQGQRLQCRAGSRNCKVREAGMLVQGASAPDSDLPRHLAEG